MLASNLCEHMTTKLTTGSARNRKVEMSISAQFLLCRDISHSPNNFHHPQQKRKLMNNQQNRKPFNNEQFQKKEIEKEGWSFRTLNAIANSNPTQSARMDGHQRYRIQHLVYCRLPKGGGNYPVRFVSNPANRMAELIKSGDYLTFTEFRFGRATGRTEREIHVREFQIISSVEKININDWKFIQSPRLRISEDEFLFPDEEYFEELLSQVGSDSSINEQINA